MIDGFDNFIRISMPSGRSALFRPEESCCVKYLRAGRDPKWVTGHFAACRLEAVGSLRSIYFNRRFFRIRGIRTIRGLPPFCDFPPALTRDLT